MLLTARRLFTGRTHEVLHDHVLDIDDGRIADIRPRASIRARDDLIDLGDATLLPGLIDVHQHLCFDASTNPVAQLGADDDHTLLLRMRLAARRALAVGITTIRDLGDRNYLSLTLRDWFPQQRGHRAAHRGLGAADHHRARALLVPRRRAEGRRRAPSRARARRTRRRRDQGDGERRQHDTDRRPARIAARP